MLSWQKLRNKFGIIIVNSGLFEVIGISIISKYGNKFAIVKERGLFEVIKIKELVVEIWIV